MSKNSNNFESRDGNKFKFLKAQLCTISGLLYEALENLNNALKKLDEGKEISRKKVEESKKKVSNSIKDVLEAESLFFQKMAIVGDIISYSTIIKGERAQIIEFKCKYGLGITIENLSSFLDFCSVHGFLPIVDKIYIEGPDKENIIDISNIKKLFTIFSFLISEPWDPQNRNSFDNEMKKKLVK